MPVLQQIRVEGTAFDNYQLLLALDQYDKVGAFLLFNCCPSALILLRTDILGPLLDNGGVCQPQTACCALPPRREKDGGGLVHLRAQRVQGYQ